MFDWIVLCVSRGLRSFCKMSMAVVCAAQLSLFGPSVDGAEAMRYRKCTLGASSGGFIFRPHRDCGNGHGYALLSCRASSGGSRRDYEKILARQQKRRVRHMKGVTPSTPDLMTTLDSEKRDQAKLDSYPDDVNDEEKHVNKERANPETVLPLDEAATDIVSASYVGSEHVAHGSEDDNELADLGDETGLAVADTGDAQDDPTAGRVQKSSK
ncbi:hypothetical protein KC19_10G173700 [Ceratodon purpureus]|uniref:Uncharacterized protein n=1 Tax=Ceratodon purpureus TaxID=3225 RepID=A0A8T0GRN6_CERPU|nr:hypothetical protein KC19_10G173700 [Ceratodon purpureus]